MKHSFKFIKQIFDEYKVIHVPYYQRDYVWGSKNDGRNLYKFIDDIFTSYSNNPESDYFIGTLAFCSAKVNDVIDGQQRITSIVLILSMLAKLKCSETIKNKNKELIMPNGNFIIQEDFYLTEELKYNLGLDNLFNSQGYNVNISKTIDRITSQINNAWSGYQENWYDNLYNYILEKVKFISLEYNNIGESLKYFLNINSLSIQLTQSDIFYSILSQSIRISGSTLSIFSIKQKISELAKNKGIEKDIEGYEAYNQNNEKGIENIIFIFLNAYYQNDRNIGALNETGIGKWMSFYKNDVFNDPIKAIEFVNKFYDYLQDFEKIYKYFSNYDSSLISKSSLYTSWILLQYENYFDILKMLLELFRTRHNYIDNHENLYDLSTKSISLDKLNEVAKRLNLTLLWNYIRSSNKRLDGFISNISLDSGNVYKRSIIDIITDIDANYIFNLNYNDNKAFSNIKIKDESRIIKVILAFQEAYLNATAEPDNDINMYLKDILLTDNFSIEHLYSIEEFSNSERLENWRNKKNKFFSDSDFDAERFKFENLSLLDKSNNSSANSDTIADKLIKYKLARKVNGSEWEYLIMSFVDNSEYYLNSNIQSLELPPRLLKSIDQNTWELSDNNREFNIKLLSLAINAIAEK